MKLMNLLAACFMLISASAFGVEPQSTGLSSNIYLLAQVDQRRDGVIDPRDRKDGPRNESETKSKRNQTANSSPSTTSKGFRMCPGEFAFCASSTCVKTGKEIEVKEADGKTTRKYPEVSCKCPIIDEKIAVEQNGKSLVGIAAVNEGNMNGSCIRPTPGTVWSYFSKEITYYPQESATPSFSTPGPAVQQTCSAGSGTGSNCWDYLCKIDSKPTNGVRTATCLCPYGEALYGAKAHRNADFVTYAGAYSANPSAACAQYPVGFPKQLLQ